MNNKLEKKDKIHMIGRICDDIKAKLIYLIRQEKLPEDWDGIELQQLFSDIASRAHDFKDRGHSFSDKKNVRRKSYENEKLVNSSLVSLT